MNRLNPIRIVLVNTTLPANIGAAARAMHTMAFSQLWVVNPKYPIDKTAQATAAGATDVLNRVTVVNNLPAALADCQLVFAASSRNRHVPRPLLTPIQAAQHSYQFLCQHQNRINQTARQTNIAIVFGREDRGLTNDELALADYHIQIPANPNYPVLNVAAAVQVICSYFYDVFSQLSQGITATSVTKQPAIDNLPADTKLVNLQLRQIWDEPAITTAQQQQLQQQIHHLLATLDLFDEQNPKRLPNRLQRLTSRLQLDEKEFQLLQAVLAKLQLALG